MWISLRPVSVNPLLLVLGLVLIAAVVYFGYLAVLQWAKMITAWHAYFRRSRGL
jgi:hypothetical protein